MFTQIRQFNKQTKAEGEKSDDEKE